MKLLVVGDTHFSNRIGYGGMGKSGLSVRFEKQLEAFERVVEYSKEVNMVVHLGDVFDSSNPTSVELREFSNFLSRFLDVGKRVVFITGNHDVGNNCSSLSWMNPLMEGERLFDLISLYESFVVDDNFIFISWVNRKELGGEERGKYIEGRLSEVDDKGSKIVFGHFPVRGCQVGDYELVKDEDFVSLDVLSQFKAVYLGHIHKRQVIENVEYVGSLVPCNFGEREDEKGFLLLSI